MKLYYIKCDDFICDVTDRFDHAQKLIKEYHYKTRQLTKQIGENYKRNSVFPYKVKY